MHADLQHHKVQARRGMRELPPDRENAEKLIIPVMLRSSCLPRRNSTRTMTAVKGAARIRSGWALSQAHNVLCMQKACSI